MLRDEDVVIENRDFLVTESTLNPKVGPSEVLAWMRDNHKTGSIQMNQGGVRSAVLVEKTKIPEGQRVAVRSLLGMGSEKSA